MENTQPEQIQNQPEIIRLNQRFPLFNLRRTHQEQRKNGMTESTTYESEIVLDTGNILPNFRIGLIVDRGEDDPYTIKTKTFTPFDPEIGYQVINDDLKLETRLAKKRRLDSMEETDMINPVESKKAPLILVIGSSSEELLEDGLIQKAGISKYGHQEYKSKSEIVEAINKLRVQVFFPRSAYEARLKFNVHDGCITVNYYYPLDTGPLPVNPSPFLTEGLAIQLPDDLNKLRQIWARFILLDEEKTDDQKDGGGER